jgi:prepilin-type N-terminal cleavage/methylation domain-containing protein
VNSIRRSDARGFTLIELMIVVVIIGILAAVAIPRFNVSAHRGKEKEADIFLKQVYVMQHAFYAQHGRFAVDETELKTVGFDPPVPMRFYEYSGNVDIPQCLVQKPSTAPWHKRGINADGNIDDC